MSQDERKGVLEEGEQSRGGFLKTALAAGALLAGCGPTEESGTSSTGGKTYEWKMVTTWPANFPALGTGANQLAEVLGKLSGGRLKVRVYGAGELVPAMETFDAVSRGAAQMGHGAAYYWKGKIEAAQFFTTVPFGLNATEMAGWLYYGGAGKLWDEIYADFNLKPFAAGNTGVQMGGWFNKEIRDVGDYRGLKMRMPGLGGEVLMRAGATVVNIPGGEIFQSLQTGAIDATEWVGPYNDLAFGFHKAARYYYWPGWHEPGTALEVIVNRSAYEELPPDLQEILRHACQGAYTDMMAEFAARNNAALEELVEKHGVQLRRFPDPVLKEMGRLSREVLGDLAARDPISKRVHESYLKFRKQSLSWNLIGDEGYSLARSLSS